MSAATLYTLSFQALRNPQYSCILQRHDMRFTRVITAFHKAALKRVSPASNAGIRKVEQVACGVVVENGDAGGGPRESAA
jgi:hypothetical protein